jgi:cell division protein FtsB
MIQELIYMSAPRGLVPGRAGFCTVAMTEELPNSWRERLESISSYDRHSGYGVNDPRQPVVFSHRFVNYKHVLSRIAPVAHEYTNRTNHIAHHLLLDDADLTASGPAAILGEDGLFHSDWTREPEWLSPDRLSKSFPKRGTAVIPCRAWNLCMGDAGWAGYLAEAFVSDPERTAILIYDPGVDVLSLIREALQFVDRPWDVKFTTYYSSSQSGQECVWRGVLRGSEAERDLARRGNILKIDLGKRAMVQKSSNFVEAARRGERLSVKSSHTLKPAKEKDAFPQRQPIDAGDNFETYAAEEISRSPERRVPAGREPPPLPQLPLRRRTSPILIVVPLLALFVGALSMWGVLNPQLDRANEKNEKLESANKDLESANKDLESANKDLESANDKLLKAATSTLLKAATSTLEKKDGKLQTEENNIMLSEKIYIMLSKAFPVFGGFGKILSNFFQDIRKRNASQKRHLDELKLEANSIRTDIKIKKDAKGIQELFERITKLTVEILEKETH